MKIFMLRCWPSSEHDARHTRRPGLCRGGMRHALQHSWWGAEKACRVEPQWRARLAASSQAPCFEQQRLAADAHLPTAPASGRARLRGAMADAIAMPSGLEESGGRASTGGGEANSQLLRLVARACVAPLLAPRRAPARRWLTRTLLQERQRRRAHAARRLCAAGVLPRRARRGPLRADPVRPLPGPAHPPPRTPPRSLTKLCALRAGRTTRISSARTW